jgi:hypothetical protein
LGGVSPSARWQYGFGKAGRFVWPRWRRGDRAQVDVGIDRIDCEGLSRRRAGSDCAWTFECVSSPMNLATWMAAMPIVGFVMSGGGNSGRMDPPKEPQKVADRSQGPRRCNVLRRMELGAESAAWK